jgi:hypothetical protein
MLNSPKNIGVSVLRSRSRDSRNSSWFRSTWFRVGFGTAGGIQISIALATHASLKYLAWQILLLLSVYISLYLLSDRRLINPIQAVVALFYWWFGLGPGVSSAFYLLIGVGDKALMTQELGQDSLWIVSIGLPLYAIIAKETLQYFSKKHIYARFLMPKGFLFQPTTLLIYWLIGLLAKLTVVGLSGLGFRGISTINYLGGMRTDIWWIGLINALGDVSIFATVGIMFSLASPGRLSPWWIKGIGLIIIVQTLAGALTSGWKSTFVIIFFYIICARISVTQRLPWRIGLAVLIGYLFIVEPFVSFARNQAEISSAESSEERQQIFRNAIAEGTLFGQRNWKDLQIESLFRGIYPLAGELVRSNSLFDGYWKGETIKRGLQIIVPRVLMPNKPDSDIGNFFARTVGSDIGIASPDNYFLNIAVSIPFEFVGNYGWLSGILSFPIIGFLWALVCGYLLSVPRISNHPFTPYMIFMAVTMESPIGFFLASLRNLMIPLFVMGIVWIALKKEL